MAKEMFNIFEEEMKDNKPKKDVIISVRVTEEQKKWMEQKGYKPSKIMQIALKKLGFQK